MSYCQMLRPGPHDAAKKPLLSAGWAMAALVIFLGWQFLTVHYNRGGNWTALYLTGQDYALPPQLAAGTYRFPGAGYDGEIYRTVAHDPFLRLGYARYVDNPPLRYERILVPALAYLLAAGDQRWIDATYMAVIALFVFLGCFWLSRWATLAGLHPAWAFAFLLAPATLISMDRMTVDVSLEAFTVAFALYWKIDSRWKLFLIVLLACLARETGLLFVAGLCVFELVHRRFARALQWSAAALPAIAWYIGFRRMLAEPAQLSVPTWFVDNAGAGVFRQMLSPPHYPLPPALEMIARIGDAVALGSVVLASLLAIAAFLRARAKNPIAISCLFFGILVFTLTTPVFWKDVNGYGRIVSPLLILVAMIFMAKDTELRVPWWSGFVPAILIDLRLGLQFQSALGGVLRGLLRV